MIPPVELQCHSSEARSFSANVNNTNVNKTFLSELIQTLGYRAEKGRNMEEKRRALS